MAKESFDKFKRAKPPQDLVSTFETKLEDAKVAMERQEKLKKEAEALAKKKAEEERARIAKEKKEAAKALLDKNKGDGKENVLDKIEKKKKLEDKLSQ
jgi:hypothetical protein